MNMNVSFSSSNTYVEGGGTDASIRKNVNNTFSYIGQFPLILKCTEMLWNKICNWEGDAGGEGQPTIGNVHPFWSFPG